MTAKCSLECLKSRDGDFLNNVDFCNVEEVPRLPYKNSMFQKTWNATYIHSAMWRWLPIGDLFVDVFSSRDIDAYIDVHEIGAVKEWLSSKEPGHIMRDHPQHGTCLLGTFKK